MSDDRYPRRMVATQIYVDWDTWVEFRRLYPRRASKRLRQFMASDVRKQMERRRAQAKSR